MRQNKNELLTTINVLGTEYKVYAGTQENNPEFTKCDGYVLTESKSIILNASNSKKHQEHVLTHELVHAFLYESGLGTEAWATNEEIVDWIAIQLSKLWKTTAEATKSIKVKRKNNL